MTFARAPERLADINKIWRRKAPDQRLADGIAGLKNRFRFAEG
jgi:hypothetical protein